MEITSIDDVVAYAVENGVPRGSIMFALRRAGCVKSEPKAKLDVDDFEQKVAKLWKRDADRLMRTVEKFYANS